MLGAIAGDIVGSIYEKGKADRLDFPLFGSGCHITDDTVLSVATAEALITQTSFEEKYKQYFNLYPYAGYGSAFKKWATSSNSQPYNSFGNGSAMRVSPIAYAFDDIDAVLTAAARSAECTHNHPEGIKGAQAIAAAVFLARLGYTKEGIRQEIVNRFGYQLSESIHHLHRYYEFDVTCQGSVPQAIIAFLESNDFESAVRNAVYIGGDSDTIACMAGAIAEAFFGGIPQSIREVVFKALDSRLTTVALQFLAEYAPERPPQTPKQRSNQIVRRLLKKVPPRIGLRIVPEKILTSTLGANERLYVCIGDYEEFKGQKLSTVAKGLYGHIGQQNEQVLNEVFGAWVNTSLAVCTQPEADDSLESKRHYVFKINLENSDELDLFPGTWKALAYILSDPVRMLSKIELYKQFIEYVEGRQPFLHSKKNSMDFYDLDRLEEENGVHPQREYYNYITTNSGYANSLFSLFGIDNRCWHGRGYIGWNFNLAGRVFLIKNIPINHPNIISCTLMDRDQILG